MNEAFIVDAHLHVDPPAQFFSPEAGLEEFLVHMDRLRVAYAVCSDGRSVYEGCGHGLARHRELFERSGGRVHYLAVFDPRSSGECLATLEEAGDPPGFVGLKIHPSLHGVGGEDPAYEPVWRFAADRDLPILTHSWSVSDYNPVQRLSTPARFERYVRRFPEVRFVLGHAGGRGLGRHEAVRMANEYPEVYLDFAGDIFCHRLIEGLVESVPVEKILFGSDFPWLDPRANLSRVLLAEVDLEAKGRILRENAMCVYSL